jgi:hypothetical protein
MSNRTIRYTIDLPSKEHKRISTMTSVLGLSMKDLFLLSVQAFAHKKLNKTTLKALEETTSEKGQHKFHSLDEMFKDLGI